MVFPKLNTRMLYMNLFSVLLFAVLYYIQDIFVTKYRTTAEKYYILDKTKMTADDDRENYSLSYHFWFSLMTQTTVGYGSTSNLISGKQYTYNDIPNRLVKVLNVMQLISILLIMAIV